MLDACYTDPLKVQPTEVCHVFLTFAIGLVMATPTPGTPEDGIVRRLRSEAINRAEIFFRTAKSMGDPVFGFEDADLTSVQALTLMAIYMLAVSKRNAAYNYIGICVRLL